VVLREIGRILGRPPEVSYGDWRAGDQLWFVADTGRLGAALDWAPRVAWRDGLRDLAAWLGEERGGAESVKRRSLA
jgi:CDP-paratose 2-epimerase